MGTIKSKIVKNKGLLLQEFSGSLTKTDMASYFSKLYTNPEYFNVSMIFSDFTKALVALSVEEISEIAFFILTNAPKVQHVNNAILVYEPLVTAYSFLYEEIMKDMPFYECKIFSTFEEATKFINWDADQMKKLLTKSFPN